MRLDLSLKIMFWGERQISEGQSEFRGVRALKGLITEHHGSMCQDISTSTREIEARDLGWDEESIDRGERNPESVGSNAWNLNYGDV